MLRNSIQPTEDASQKDSDNDDDTAGITSHPSLTSDQWQMLEYLIDHPDETVTAMYRALGYGAGRGSRIRQHLGEEDLIVEVETRLGQGNRPATFIVPTVAGFEAVNKPLRSGRGGPVHRHFQEVVARHAQSLGYQARIEHRLNSGGSVDVHLSKEGLSVAVEIAIHSKPQRECKNIRKCLEAGYSRVIALFLDSKLLNETRASFMSNVDEKIRQRVVFSELERLKEAVK